MQSLGSELFAGFDFGVPDDEPAAAAPYVLCSAELAECTCPDACERDHELD
jgi:hypothetical protein